MEEKIKGRHPFLGGEESPWEVHKDMQSREESIRIRVREEG